LNIRYSTVHTIFNVHKAGLLYCFERNIRSLSKIKQVHIYVDLVLELLHLCQKKKILFTSENFSNQSWQAYLILSVDDNKLPPNKKIRIFLQADIILTQNSQPFGILLDLRPFREYSPQVKREGCRQ